MKKLILFFILIASFRIHYLQAQNTQPLYIWFGQATPWGENDEEKLLTEYLPPSYENIPFSVSNFYSGYFYEITLWNVLVATPHKRFGLEGISFYSAKNSPPLTVPLSELGNHVDISQIRTMKQVGEETAQLIPQHLRFKDWWYFTDRDIYLVEKDTTNQTATISKVKFYFPIR